MKKSYNEPKIAPKMVIKITVIIVNVNEEGGERSSENVKSRILITLE